MSIPFWPLVNCPLIPLHDSDQRNKDGSHRAARDGRGGQEEDPARGKLARVKGGGAKRGQPKGAPRTARLLLPAGASPLPQRASPPWPDCLEYFYMEAVGLGRRDVAFGFCSPQSNAVSRNALTELTGTPAVTQTNRQQLIHGNRKET
jgi:hypothetical protein